MFLTDTKRFYCHLLPIYLPFRFSQAVQNNRISLLFHQSFVDSGSALKACISLDCKMKILERA